MNWPWKPPWGSSGGSRVFTERPYRPADTTVWVVQHYVFFHATQGQTIASLHSLLYCLLNFGVLKYYTCIHMWVLDICTFFYFLCNSLTERSRESGSSAFNYFSSATYTPSIEFYSSGFKGLIFCVCRLSELCSRKKDTSIMITLQLI